MKMSGGALVPAVGWKISTWDANTTTPQTTWSDGQLSSENTNPIISDADGGFRIFIAQGDSIKCTVTDEDDVPQFPYTFDYQQPMIPEPSAAASTAVQTGTILMWSTDTAPTGYLLCDGSAVSRITFADLNTLWAAATPPYPFGTGNGTTTMNVPDLRGRFPLGVAASGTGDTLGETGGLIDHVHAGGAHTHPATVTRDNWGATLNSPSTTGRLNVGDAAGAGQFSSSYQPTDDLDLTTGSSGTGDTGTANPPYLAVNYIVKT